MKIKHDGRDWSQYPVGTKAFAITGGHWIKVDYGSGKLKGWKWCTGSVFPSPGGDTNGWVELPDPNALYDAKVREVAEILAEKNYPKRHLRKDRFPDLWESAIEQSMPSARAMVEKMEKAVEIAMAPNHSAEYIKNWQITLGLTPAKPENNA